MKPTEPLISIITPSYNAVKTVGRTVRSVQDQTFSNWELLICDDCSTDGTDKILKTLSSDDKRIKVFYSPSNGGPAIARNICLNHARGKYFCFIDADDAWKVDFLDSQLNFIKKSKAKGVFASYSRVDLAGDKVLNDFIAPRKVSYRDILKTNSISCLTVMIKSELVGKTRMRDEGIEDLDFWLELLKKEKYFYGNSTVLAEYTIAKGTRSSSKLKLIKPQWNTYRKCQRLSIVCSSYFLLNWAFNGIKKYIK